MLVRGVALGSSSVMGTMFSKRSFVPTPRQKKLAISYAPDWYVLINLCGMLTLTGLTKDRDNRAGVCSLVRTHVERVTDSEQSSLSLPRQS